MSIDEKALDKAREAWQANAGIGKDMLRHAIEAYEAAKVPDIGMSISEQPVESLRHLGNVLVILAELHPDDQCRAYTEALAYHNQKCPDAIVEPIMGVTRLVHTY